MHNMKKLALALGGMLLLSGTAQAEDPMDVQRCIWRCLSEAKGADDPVYHQCVAQYCNGDEQKPAKKPAKEKKNKSGGQSSAKASQGRKTGVLWTYGDHAVLGRSAHVAIGDETLGIACLSAKESGGTRFRASLRTTPGLFKHDGGAAEFGYVFSEPFRIEGWSTVTDKGHGYLEATGDACSVLIPKLQNADELLLVRGTGFNVDLVNDARVLNFKNAGTGYRIATSKDLEGVKDFIRVPLNGSSKALSQLLDACPVLRKQVKEDCL